MGICRLESEAHPLTWQGAEAAKSMSACFGACSSVGVCFAAPIPPWFVQAPPERLALAEQPVYVHLPVCVWNHREALFSSAPISLVQNLREERGGDITAQRSHQTVCLTVPQGNQFNSPQLLASRGRGGGGTGKTCVWEKEEKEGGLLLPFWVRGKSNKIELMGVWSFRGQRVGFCRQALVGNGGGGGWNRIRWVFGKAAEPNSCFQLQLVNPCQA